MIIASEDLELFVRESNWIEGIRRNPTMAEVAAHVSFLQEQTVDVASFQRFVSAVQPGAILRDREHLNVRVGDHRPPPGGPRIPLDLAAILRSTHDAYDIHHMYETLHPFTDGNGRSGRVLWLRMMHGDAPLGFLHTWYYQSLSHDRR